MVSGSAKTEDEPKEGRMSADFVREEPPVLDIPADDAPEFSNILSFDDIMAADDLGVRVVAVPEWRGSVRLRVLSAKEAIDFQVRMRDPKKKHEAWVDIFALCAVNEAGQRLFNERSIHILQKKSTAVFMRLQRVLLEMNGFAQPQKTWETVQKILETSGVEVDVINRVEQKWREDDEAPVKNG